MTAIEFFRAKFYRLQRRRAAVATGFLAAAIFLLLPRANAQSAPPQFVYTIEGSMIFAFQLNPATGALTALPSAPFDERLSPAAMAVNPAGTFLFIANGDGFNNVSVFSINTTTGALTEVANSPFATGLGLDPVSITTDANGKFLYVGNTTGASLTNGGEIDAYTINQTTGELTPTPNSTSPADGAGAPLKPNGVFAHPNGRWIYFQGGNYGTSVNDTVQGYVINAATGDLDGSIPPYNGITSARYLQGDPAGQFLIDEYAETCVNLQPLLISATDGSLVPVSNFSVIGTGLCSLLGNMAIDYTGNYLYSAIGSFSVTGGVVVPDQLITPNNYLPSGPWAADLIGPFMFAGNTEYMIDETTGALTVLPGFPAVPGFGIGSLTVVTGYPPQTPAPGAGFLPAGLAFANTTVGVASAPQTIELVDTGTATLDISGISITGPNAADFSQTNTCGATLTAGANCVFTVIYTPSTTAAEDASISVTDNATGSPHLVSITGMGLPVTPPFAQLSTSSVNFPTTNLGSTNTQTFTITNTGTQTLTVSTVAVGGSNLGDFTETNNCIGNVAGGALCTVTVVFQPQAVGQRTATVSMTGNVGIASVALTGTGANPFTVAPTGATSATVPPGQPASYALSFTPTAAFSGTVMFSCSVVPAGPSCTVSPTSVQVAASNNPQATPVSITATAPAAAVAAQRSAFHFGTSIFGARPKQLPALTPIALLAIAMYCGLASFKKNSGRALISANHWQSAGLLLVVAALTALAACGGGSGGGSTTPPQPKTYTVKVSAAAGTSTQVVSFTLNVQ
jgi:centrosomal CEP192-like protein/lactonase family protein with 7-bladed beta-propeller